MLDQVTGLILTFNEKENIARCLGPLSWAKEVVIVDSGSTDGTLEIARSAHPNVRIKTRAFDNHTAQWNFGIVFSVVRSARRCTLRERCFFGDSWRRIAMKGMVTA